MMGLSVILTAIIDKFAGGRLPVLGAYFFCH